MLEKRIIPKLFWFLLTTWRKLVTFRVDFIAFIQRTSRMLVFEGCLEFKFFLGGRVRGV